MYVLAHEFVQRFSTFFGKLFAFKKMPSSSPNAERLRADPCVTMADLEMAFTTFFGMVGHRDLGGYLEEWKREAVTWKTAAKDLSMCCQHFG